MNNAAIILATRQWLSEVVVGLELCPFANAPLAAGSVRFAVTAALSQEELLQQLANELTILDDDDTVETVLLIHPNVLQDFGHYNPFLSVADALLADLGYEGVYQLASFHPDYQFAGTSAQDAENYSNRSPYAMLHLLREKSVERAIDAYPDPGQIPQRNIQRLNEMGREQLAQLLAACAGAVDET